jgi:glycosyltransferase involved in cell wall biosynthesis
LCIKGCGELVKTNQSVLDAMIVCGAGIVSGKEIMALELSNGLIERGRSVHVITSFWNNGDFPKRLERLRIPAHVLPIGFISATLTKRCLEMTMEQVRRWPRLLFGYSSLLRSLRPQKVIHTNWQHLLLVLPFVREERDLFWVHDLVPDLRQYRRLFGLLAHRVGAFICVSHATASSLRKIGIGEDKIRVVHNGIADPAASAHIAFRAAEPFRIGIVGQVGPWKGHDTLLEAFALLERKHSKVELHIFGRGRSPYGNELRQKAAELSIAEKITWHEFVPDIREIYPGFDVCVVPSKVADSFGLVALEAGFFGLPSVVSCKGGLPEIVEHGVSGLVVEPEKPVELAEALFRLINEPSLRQRLGANARRRAVEYFGRERFLNEFMAVLNANQPQIPTA